MNFQRSLLLAVLINCCSINSISLAKELEWIKVSKDGKGFSLHQTNSTFLPWGFNYDHDSKGRLIEDYWIDEWNAVAQDFEEMRELGANVVRVHLQFGRFMKTANQPNEAALKQLSKLVLLAEKTGLYLDITGLGCYHKDDVPQWYNRLSEMARWDAQAEFWKHVASVCAKSPAIFCYDLMNEPVVPGGKRKDGDWLGPAFAGKHFVQVITLDQAERPRPKIAHSWIKHLSKAIRSVDERHLITVGLVDWSLDRPGLTSGFVPKEIISELDFVCVHLYPNKGKLEEDLTTLKGFSLGKPVVIEETFPLKCSMEDFTKFINAAKDQRIGVIGFYWGKPTRELRQSKEFADALLLAWLEVFQANRPKP